MQNIIDTSKAILESSRIPAGAKWATPVIRYTIVLNNALPRWLVTRLHGIKNPQASWNILADLAANSELPHKDFESPGQPLPSDLAPFFHRALEHWGNCSHFIFIRDDNTPTLYFHFSESSRFGSLSMWSASTILDIKNGTIVNAAINFNIDSLRQALAGQRPCFTQHTFTHELGHTLGLHHPNVTKPSFRVDHTTIMGYAQDNNLMVCSPTESDHVALRTLYGPHSVSVENNTYFFNTTSVIPYEIQWKLDHAGTDTLWVNCPSGKYDLRDGILEGCDHMEFFTPNAIENIHVTGKNVLIRLNSQQNYVDIQRANMTSIYTDATEGAGNSDIVVGLKCGDRFLITHTSIQPNFTATPESMRFLVGNYTLTAHGNFSSGQLHIHANPQGSLITFDDPQCPYVENSPPALSTFVTTFLKTSLVDGLRALLKSFGLGREAIEVFDRILIGALVFHETRNMYATTLMAIFGPALHVLCLSKKQADIIETVLTMGIGAYQNPAQMLIRFSGSFFYYGAKAAVGYLFQRPENTVRRP